MNSPAVQANPPLQGLAAELLLFMVRKAHVGRSLEQKIEQAVEDMANAPDRPQQPDPLTIAATADAQKKQADVVRDQQKNRIDAFEAETDRLKAMNDVRETNVKATEAAQDSERKDLETANKILDSNEIQAPNGVLGNA